jgi:hypothetical protein
LRQNIPDRSRRGLELFPHAGNCRIDDIVEQQMPFVQGIMVPGEPDRTATILLEKIWGNGDIP